MTQITAFVITVWRCSSKTL